MGTRHSRTHRPAAAAHVPAAVAAVAALAVLLAGCGSDTEASAEGGREDATTQADVEPTTDAPSSAPTSPSAASNSNDDDNRDTTRRRQNAGGGDERGTRRAPGKTAEPSKTSDTGKVSGTRSAKQPQARPRPELSPQSASQPEPQPAPKRAKKPQRTFYVARVIDGDTVELGNGQGVRLVGIDTPERGECGFDAATDTLVRLVEGKRVRLTQPDEDTDRYGRLLRYLNIGDLDPGLRLIKNGLATARYDSRDGYGYHPREPIYIAADKNSNNRKCAAPAPQRTRPAPKNPARSCAAGYAPCIPSYPPDVNCSDVNGPITVRGSDPHGLDADGDGVACE